MLEVHAKKLDTVEILRLEGRIVNGETDILRSAVQSASGRRRLILDLSNVTLVDAHGLGVLLQLREQALTQGISFKVVNVSRSLYRLFEITRLNTVFDITVGVPFAPDITAQRQLVAA